MTYYLLSLKHSRGDYLTWWKPNRRGYTIDIREAGRYEDSEIETTNSDGDPVIKKQFFNRDTVAIPVEDVHKLHRRTVADYSTENLRELGINVRALPEY